jgi:MazG family protein
MSMAGAAFGRLVDIMATLRGPDGCPWDREQTFRSLSQFVLEEAYEVIDAIERNDHPALREEIGDHIFEGVFLAQIAADQRLFTVADSLNAVSDKLVRRHPHVFQDDGRVHDAGSKERAPSADAALSRWDSQKAQEKADAGDSPASALGELPQALPALLRAYKLGKRAAGVGFDWPTADGVMVKIEEEVAELRESLGREDAAHAATSGGSGGRGRDTNSDTEPDPNAARDLNAERVEEEMGDLLFAIANLSRKLGIEPEAALRRANQKFEKRFAAMEARINASGRTMPSMTIEELEGEWRRVK